MNNIFPGAEILQKMFRFEVNNCHYDQIQYS